MADHVATAESEIDAPPSQVWAALTDPEQIKKYMFGSQVETDWLPGSPIVWKGEYEGKQYEDKGTVFECERERLLVSTYWSSLSGKPDVPERYNTVVYELSEADGGTRLTIVQDNNDSAESAQHSQQNWEMVLARMKQLLEQ